MKATSGTLPKGSGWAYELKWDGMRVLADVRPEAVSAWTSNGLDATTRFPELAALGPALAPVECVLDGEVVALVQGRPSFARLQKRMNTLRPSTAVRRQVPVTYLPFDVLRLDGGNLIAAPYLERRAALTDLGHELHGAGLPLQVLPHWVFTLPSDTCRTRG